MREARFYGKRTDERPPIYTRYRISSADTVKQNVKGKYTGWWQTMQKTVSRKRLGHSGSDLREQSVVIKNPEFVHEQFGVWRGVVSQGKQILQDITGFFF